MTGYDSGGRSAATRFRPSQPTWHQMPIGAYRQDSARFWSVKVTDTAPAGSSRRDWRAVHHLTWEAAHGPVPPGHAVIFVDGNRDNCLDAGNLECIPLSVLAVLNKKRFSSLRDPELRRAAIATARVFGAAHRAAEGLGLSWPERKALIGTLGSFAETAHG
jgi:hypothetical protein